MPEKHPIGEISERLRDVAEQGDTAYRDLIDSFGRTAFATCLLVPSLILASPLSGVPFASTFLGITIFLIAIQAVMSRRTIWLPRVLLNRKISQTRVGRAADVTAKAGNVLDKLTRERLQFLVGPIARHLLYMMCAVAGACLPFLEVIPFSSSIVGAGIACVSLGILTRDGVFSLIGVPVICIGLSLPLYAVQLIVG